MQTRNPISIDIKLFLLHQLSTPAQAQDFCILPPLAQCLHIACSPGPGPRWRCRSLAMVQDLYKPSGLCRPGFILQFYHFLLSYRHFYIQWEDNSCSSKHGPQHHRWKLNDGTKHCFSRVRLQLISSHPSTFNLFFAWSIRKLSPATPSALVGLLTWVKWGQSPLFQNTIPCL